MGKIKEGLLYDYSCDEQKNGSFYSFFGIVFNNN